MSPRRADINRARREGFADEVARRPWRFSAYSHPLMVRAYHRGRLAGQVALMTQAMRALEHVMRPVALLMSKCADAVVRCLAGDVAKGLHT